MNRTDDHDHATRIHSKLRRGVPDQPRPAVFASSGASQSLTQGAVPISAEERLARIVKVQGLMRQRNTAALFIGARSDARVFTGIRWRRSERSLWRSFPPMGNSWS